MPPDRLNRNDAGGRRLSRQALSTPAQDLKTSLRKVSAGSHGGDPILVDVVFVHGLGGNDVSTWQPDESESPECWLNWLAEDIPSIAVWSLKYPAGATKWTAEGEGMALPDRAANLIPTMLYYGIGSRKTIFVCHSLGGLVVKQILRHSTEMAQPEWQKIAESTLGVAFLATPHSGSSLASILKAVRLSRATKTSLALTAHCPHLKELGDWYRQNVKRLEIETAAYAESRRVRYRFRLATVVNATSANPGVEGCILTSIDADHIDICKPASRETDTYRGVETFIRRQLTRLCDDEISLNEAAKPAPESTLDTQGPQTLDPQERQTLLPAELVQQIREIQAMGDMKLLDPFEVKELKMGILNRHYGVGDE
ncbi:triacylglycerol lipase [Streptomyces sp. PanSC9]|uniref:esterase/lipase family protein n=1 Tax=Streptomyces sp. PanSC9 TaxID=1520461 RepID=UPI0011CDA528|nr:hypothetical protein [Streptomyces sp. PanSC9]